MYSYSHICFRTVSANMFSGQLAAAQRTQLLIRDFVSWINKGFHSFNHSPNSLVTLGGFSTTHCSHFASLLHIKSIFTKDFSCFPVRFAPPRTVWELEEAARALGTRQPTYNYWGLVPTAQSLGKIFSLTATSEGYQGPLVNIIQHKSSFSLVRLVRLVISQR